MVTPVGMDSPIAVLLGAAVTEESPGVMSRLPVVLDRHLAVDEHVAVAAGALEAPPLAAGKVVGNLGRQDLEPLEVIDDHVRRRTFHERAAVAEPRTVRRQRRQPPVGVLEGAHPLLAYDPGEELRRV